MQLERAMMRGIYTIRQEEDCYVVYIGGIFEHEYEFVVFNLWVLSAFCWSWALGVERDTCCRFVLTIKLAENQGR